VSKIKRLIGTKATKAAAKHTAHGLSDKARRKPLRSASLLGAGVAVGLVAGWAAARAGAGAS
jgi:uncharacterized protein YfiM (DUF2279 family)